ncbi:hypothetical protein HNR22_000060 [Micromonospora jinlongensis]|uniref:Uncharacterized protein n=1 Tax=Micromonospora jinlongensis TaxID=1287877 RepID=A0A7Z0BAM8_9ACTN|nr:hypothetical protein [Micromonospora jinlongensis]NYH40333.1 hypothetical protein [Micromonospora jinlongensis]
MNTAERRSPSFREQADRLTLIDRWGHFVLDQPVLVYPGEAIWRKGDQLMVQRLDGRVDAYPGFVNR